MLLQVARHVNPANTVERPFFVPAVDTGVAFDTLSNNSYFKFNLDYMSFYQLMQRQDNTDNRDAYQTLRNYTATHQNPFFNMVDRALRGPDAARDAETRTLLDQWLQRPRRDFYVDVSSQVPVCGSDACSPDSRSAAPARHVPLGGEPVSTERRRQRSDRKLGRRLPSAVLDGALLRRDRQRQPHPIRGGARKRRRARLARVALWRRPCAASPRRPAFCRCRSRSAVSRCRSPIPPARSESRRFSTFRPARSISCSRTTSRPARRRSPSTGAGATAKLHRRPSNPSRRRYSA